MDTTQDLYSMHVVWARDGSISSNIFADEMEERLEAKGIKIRGWYDLSGFRADADLMVWLTSNSIDNLLDAYHSLNRSALAPSLKEVWQGISKYMPELWHGGSMPACFADDEPGAYLTVYPLTHTADWYFLSEEDKDAIRKEVGIVGDRFPGLKLSHLAAFGLGDHEWIISMESDSLNPLIVFMRQIRTTRSRNYISNEMPCFTAPRVELEWWLRTQP